MYLDNKGTKRYYQSRWVLLLVPISLLLMPPGCISLLPITFNTVYLNVEVLLCGTAVLSNTILSTVKSSKSRQIIILDRSRYIHNLDRYTKSRWLRPRLVQQALCNGTPVPLTTFKPIRMWQQRKSSFIFSK